MPPNHLMSGPSLRRLPALGCAGLVGLLLVLGAPTGAAAQPIDPPYRVCVDPGHTLADDVGATTAAVFGEQRIPLREVDLNLDVAHALRRALLARGVEVVMTWDGAPAGWPEAGAPDEPPAPTLSADPGLDDPAGLEARGRLCMEAGAEVMFSVHHNALFGAGNGLITLYRDPGHGQRDHDRSIARVVHDVMWQHLNPGKRVRGFVNFGLFRADWGVARGAVGIPTVICEPVIITDAREAQLLVPTIAQGGARRQQIVLAELSAVLAARGPVRGVVASAPP